jgi:hypothetical protein
LPRYPPRARALARGALLLIRQRRMPTPIPMPGHRSIAPKRARWPCLRGWAHFLRLSPTNPVSSNACAGLALRHWARLPVRSEIKLVHVLARSVPTVGEPPGFTGCPQAAAQSSRTLFYSARGLLRVRRLCLSPRPWPHGHGGRRGIVADAGRPFPREARAHFPSSSTACALLRFPF